MVQESWWVADRRTDVKSRDLGTARHPFSKGLGMAFVNVERVVKLHLLVGKGLRDRVVIMNIVRVVQIRVINVHLDVGALLSVVSGFGFIMDVDILHDDINLDMVNVCRVLFVKLLSLLLGIRKVSMRFITVAVCKVARRSRQGRVKCRDFSMTMIQWVDPLAVFRPRGRRQW